MNTAPSSDFIRFVFDQPENRKISHTRGWSGCAVGDFFSEYRETSIAQELNKLHPNLQNEDMYRCLQSLIIPVVGPYLERSLNNSNWNHFYAQTYGILADTIERHFPDETKAALMRPPVLQRALSRITQEESRPVSETQSGEERTPASHRAAAKLCEVPE